MCIIIIIIISKLQKLSAANALVDYKHTGLFLCRQAGICEWHNKIIRHSHFCTWPGQFKSSRIIMQQTKFCHSLLELLIPAK